MKEREGKGGRYRKEDSQGISEKGRKGGLEEVYALSIIATWPAKYSCMQC